MRVNQRLVNLFVADEAGHQAGLGHVVFVVLFGSGEVRPLLVRVGSRGRLKRLRDSISCCRFEKTKKQLADVVRRAPGLLSNACQSCRRREKQQEGPPTDRRKAEKAPEKAVPDTSRSRLGLASQASRSIYSPLSWDPLVGIAEQSNTQTSHTKLSFTLNKALRIRTSGCRVVISYSDAAFCGHSSHSTE